MCNSFLFYFIVYLEDEMLAWIIGEIFKKYQMPREARVQISKKKQGLKKSMVWLNYRNGKKNGNNIYFVIRLFCNLCKTRLISKMIFHVVFFCYYIIDEI